MLRRRLCVELIYQRAVGVVFTLLRDSSWECALILQATVSTLAKVTLECVNAQWPRKV